MDTQQTVQIETERSSIDILCQNKRNKFLNCLKSHFHLMKLFSVEHKKLLDRMLILSTKLNVIERYKCYDAWLVELGITEIRIGTLLSVKLLSTLDSIDNRPKCLPYSNGLIWRVRGEILNTLNSITSQISRNLQQQSNSFICLRQFHEEFIITSKAVDWNDQSRLCNGSATEKPLFYYVDHSIDIMYCLNIYEQAIQFNKSHIDVRDSSSIARFLNSVSIPQNFHDLITDVLLNSCFVDKTEKVRNKS